MGVFMGMFASPKKPKNDSATKKKNSKPEINEENDECEECSSSMKNPAQTRMENKEPYAFMQAGTAKPTQKTTKVIVKCNCGFPNSLYIRGEGISGLSWDRGQKMTNIKPDEWVWETDKPFQRCQFKVLINDKQYEAGENHTLDCGKAIICSPKF